MPLQKSDLLLNCSVTADELQRWPLVHGSVILYQHHATIKANGLLAPSQSDIRLNTRSEDVLLGREQYVFCSPLWLKNGYGFGSLILIDPIVLRKPGVQFALQDVFVLIKLIKNILSGLASFDKFPQWIPSPDKLCNLLNEFKEEVDASIEEKDDTLRELIRNDRALKLFLKSEGFSRYWAAFTPTCDDFFKAIEVECKKHDLNLYKYATRDLIWSLTEEIMIPTKIEPEYILGYWTGQNWEPWHLPHRSDLLDRVQACVDCLSI